MDNPHNLSLGSGSANVPLRSIVLPRNFDGRASLAHSSASFRGFLSLGSWMAWVEWPGSEGKGC